MKSLFNLFDNQSLRNVLLHLFLFTSYLLSWTASWWLLVGLNLNPKQSDILGITNRKREMQSDTNNSIKKRNGLTAASEYSAKAQRFRQTLLLPKHHSGPGI